MSEKNSGTRPSIPAELKRQVLVEAGHRCAIPTCKQTEIDIHHIVPWETCKEHAFDNLIALCPNCHRRVHNGDIDRKSLVTYKRSLSQTVHHGIVTSGTVTLDRAEGELHVLTAGGNFTITTSGWTSGAQKIVLKLWNGGRYTSTWEGFKSLPFASGVTLTVDGYDVIEINHYDGDIHWNRIASSEHQPPPKPVPVQSTLQLVDSFPRVGDAISVEDIKRLSLTFNNPIARNTACYIGILQFRQNSLYQWDGNGWIQYADNDKKLIWHIHENLWKQEPSYNASDVEYHRFELHVGRGHPDNCVKDVYGNALPQIIIPVKIKP